MMLMFEFKLENFTRSWVEFSGSKKIFRRYERPSLSFMDLRQRPFANIRVKFHIFFRPDPYLPKKPNIGMFSNYLIKPPKP